MEKLTTGSWTDEKDRFDGVNAKGSWGEHEAGKDDAALPLDSLQEHATTRYSLLVISRPSARVCAFIKHS